jgi:sec-independent protein translocase protein TatB
MLIIIGQWQRSMFDIGSPELLIVAVVALLVLGPERLPEALRGLAGWWGRARRRIDETRQQLEDEIGFDRIRAQLHEEAVVDEIKSLDIQLKELSTGNGTGLTELAPSDSSDPTRWPGMPPPDIHTGQAQ